MILCWLVYVCFILFIKLARQQLSLFVCFCFVMIIKGRWHGFWKTYKVSLPISFFLYFIHNYCHLAVISSTPKISYMPLLHVRTLLLVLAVFSNNEVYIYYMKLVKIDDILQCHNWAPAKQHLWETDNAGGFPWEQQVVKVIR